MYTALVFLHVLSAIVGLGPTASLVVWQTAFRSPAEVLTVLRGSERLESRIITPGGSIAIVTGLLLVPAGPYAFTDGWVLTSIALVVISLGIVHRVLKPATRTMITELEQRGEFTPAFRRQLRRTQRFGPIGTVSLVLIVVLMVFKPF